MSNYEKVYSTTAWNTGGRDGRSYLTDGSQSLKIATPKALGGSGEGTNPEELFALGYSACFHSALEVVKGQHQVKGASQVKQEIDLYKKPDAADFRLGTVIQVGIEGLDLDQVQKLAEEAHTVCPYSKATQGNIDVKIEAIEYDPEVK
ncbi:MAG: organic hydroperoxide resistance protein [Facklamia hominis]|uniref:organic hydroperoxide resistance protein n=1 Tax=Facklamia hominis TaxID=178214 RepID=UPI0028890D77|nr:organic hydroperoxide resistance protein [Facklamia hominis]